jgi:hypothetical protein
MNVTSNALRHARERMEYFRGCLIALADDPYCVNACNEKYTYWLQEVLRLSGLT